VLGATAVLALIVALVLAWPRGPGPMSSRAIGTHGSVPSTPSTTTRSHPHPLPTSTVPTTSTPPNSTIPTTSIPGGSTIPTVPLTTTTGTEPKAQTGSVQPATPAQSTAITAGIVNPPGPPGDVFVSSSDPSYAAVDIGGSPPGVALMEDEGGTWTEVAEGSPQIPCSTSTEYGLPLQVKSDLGGFMQPCG
jgi:hypothetical protein